MIKFISNSDHYSSILSHCKDRNMMTVASPEQIYSYTLQFQQEIRNSLEDVNERVGRYRLRQMRLL